MNNEKGNLAVSVILGVIAVLSGMILTALVMGDRVSLEKNADSMQSAHFLRTSLDRGSAIMSSNDDLSTATGVFERKIVTDKAKNKIFTLRSEIKSTDGDGNSSAFNLSSYVEANNGRRTGYRDFNPSAKYAEQIYLVENLADFMIFVDNSISVNDDPAYFWGRNMPNYGRIHSNTDMVINTNDQHFTGFNGLVTCSNDILYSNGTSLPLDDPNIFPGGVLTRIAEKVLLERADKLRNNSTWIDDNQDLTYICVMDHVYWKCEAQITDLPPETFHVYIHFHLMVRLVIHFFPVKLC